MAPDGMLTDSGEVLEIEPPRGLVLKWRNEFRPELRAEGYSRLTYQLEPEGKSVSSRLFTKSRGKARSLSRLWSNGWPHILASLKSLLENRRIVGRTREWPREAM